uniref:Uncharacterized protein n=1 Tax=Sander lucioperca TaxID=283035 RepID=A0A8C9YLH0_SANLU
VVKSAGPVDGDVCLLLVQLQCPKRIFQQQLEEKKQTLTSLHLFAILRHVVWSDGPQELNVVITVVFCHLFTTGFVDITHIDLHFPVQSIVEKEVVCHADPVGLHGMALAIVVVPHIPLERKHYPDKFTLQFLLNNSSNKSIAMTQLPLLTWL